MSYFRATPAFSQPGRWAVAYAPPGQAMLPGQVFDTEAEAEAEALRLNTLEDDPQLSMDG